MALESIKEKDTLSVQQSFCYKKPKSCDQKTSKIVTKISNININFNNKEGLRSIIESVLSQKNVDFEYMVIDGGSTDGSKDVFLDYTDRLTRWVSEPDKGY